MQLEKRKSWKMDLLLHQTIDNTEYCNAWVLSPLIPVQQRCNCFQGPDSCFVLSMSAYMPALKIFIYGLCIENEYL